MTQVSLSERLFPWSFVSQFGYSTALVDFSSECWKSRRTDWKKRTCLAHPFKNVPYRWALLSVGSNGLGNTGLPTAAGLIYTKTPTYVNLNRTIPDFSWKTARESVLREQSLLRLHRTLHLQTKYPARTMPGQVRIQINLHHDFIWLNGATI